MGAARNKRGHAVGLHCGKLAKRQNYARVTNKDDGGWAVTGERAGGPSGCRKRLDLELAGGYVVGSFRKNSVTQTLKTEASCGNT